LSREKILRYKIYKISLFFTDIIPSQLNIVVLCIFRPVGAWFDGIKTINLVAIWVAGMYNQPSYFGKLII
jgi:hypothetical protein